MCKCSVASVLASAAASSRSRDQDQRAERFERFAGQLAALERGELLVEFGGDGVERRLAAR